jgi:autotransporter-associated beta strand protein
MVNVSVTTTYDTLTGPSFTYVTPPAVTRISPIAGPESGGTPVLITGTNFSGATAVDFGGVPATSFTVNPDGTITAVSPAGDVSIVDVTVVTGGGADNTNFFTYVPVPSLTSISSAAGPFSGGEQLTITGHRLGNATAVYFADPIGNVAATIVGNTNTDDQIVVTVPPSNGYLDPVDVIVVTAGGTTAITAADQFTYVPPPTVTGISPPSGFRAGGTLVTIQGTGLDEVTAVDFGPNAGTIVDESADTIDVLSPAGAVGTVDVTVVAPGGTSTTSLADQFTYLQPPPVVMGLSQSVGPAWGGTPITISGTDLDGAMAVDFGTAPATIVLGSDTATQITVICPAGTDGAVDVTVTTPGGTSTTSLLDQFTYVAAPAVSSVVSLSAGAAGSVAAGPTSGGTEVTIYGTDLDTNPEGPPAVSFGGTAGTIVSYADTYIIALSPPGSAGTVDVTVTTPYGTSATSSADQFTYLATPSAAADSYTATQDSTLTVPAGGGVLANDTGTDLADFPLSATLLTEPANGTLSFNSDGSFSYTPNSGYLGPDSFTYEATDGFATSGPTTVSISVAPATMIWIKGWFTGTTSTGDWTEQQWSGANLPYPDNTVSAMVETPLLTPSVVQVTSNQAAEALTIGLGGQVAVGPGAVLSVTANTSVTNGGTLSVDPNGAFFTGGTLTLDTAGNLSGGPITAAAYQLNDGTASADLSGPGGVTKDTGGTVTLSGTNTYADGTAVDAGTLVVTSANALPDGTSLTVGAGGVFIFDPSSSAAPIAASSAATFVSIATSAATTGDARAATAVPNSASPSSSSPVLPTPAAINVSAPRSMSVSNSAVESLVQSTATVVTPPVAWLLPASPLGPQQTSKPGKPVAAGALGRPAADQAVWSSTAKRIVGNLPWLGQTANNSNNSDQQRKKDVAILALNAVFAQYG